MSDQDFPPYEVHKLWQVQEKESVCAEADRLVSTERGHNYGHPLDDFGKVVGMAQALWGRGPETEEEHALYMILVKLSRLANNPGHRDSLVDIAGYAKTYEMILERRSTATLCPKCGDTKIDCPACGYGMDPGFA